MKKKTTPADSNLLAKFTAGQSTCQPSCETIIGDALIKVKNPAAVALGRLGGLKGGKARAEKLSANERKEIAIKAAQARWSKK